jgi:hypothetical protein
MSEDKIDIRGEIEAAIKKGQYPDRAAAVAGMQKQLVDYQKGALKDKLKDVPPVKSVEVIRDSIWKELLQTTGGDEDKAAELYMEELKKLNL